MHLFYDISMSRQYRGTPHGMNRVEVSIAKELLQIDCELTPIWLDKYSELEIGELIDLRILVEESSLNQTKLSNWVIQSQAPRMGSTYLRELKGVSRRNRILVIITYTISMLPDVLSNFIWNASKKVFFYISKRVKLSRRIASRKFRKENVGVNKRNHEIFDSKSLILIAGNDWDRRILERIPTGVGVRPKIGVVVHDLIPYEYPDLSVDRETSWRFSFWIGDIAQRSDYLFFVSRFSQERFNEMLQERCIESQAKQMVISMPPGIMPGPEACEPDFANELKNPFILVVCTIEVRKNHQILLSALRLADSQSEEFPQLVFIGSVGWGTVELMREIRTDERLKNRVVLKSGISDNELRWLYGACTAVAYPSIMEGFGLPVFESAVFNKPIITSDISVFDEIPHPLRTKVNPHDSEGWKNALQNAGSQIEPQGGWLKLEPPTWKQNVEKMFNFMSEENSH